MIPSKRQREQRNAAKTASNDYFKKRRSEASSLPILVQLKTDDITDTQSKFANWFWNEAYETNSNTKEGENDDIDELDFEMERPTTEWAVSCEGGRIEIKWNREGEDRLCRRYAKEKKRT